MVVKPPANSSCSTSLEVSKIWKILEAIHDPEIPVLNIVEMGFVRNVEVNNNGVIITITPTYSGCPAIELIQSEIRKVLAQAGTTEVAIETSYLTPWTTDWLSDVAREKLRAYGISPPLCSTSSSPATLKDGDRDILVQLKERPTPAMCPFCKSTRTSETSAFGSTACKSLHFCSNCNQPFEHFKRI